MAEVNADASIPWYSFKFPLFFSFVFGRRCQSWLLTPRRYFRYLTLSDEFYADRVTLGPGPAVALAYTKFH